MTTDKCLVTHEYVQLSSVGPLAVYLHKAYHLKHSWQTAIDERYEVCARCHKMRPRQTEQQAEVTR